MIDQLRAHAARKFCHRAERNQFAGRRMNVESAQRGRILLELGFDFEDHLIFVGRRINRRNLTRAKGVAQRRLDLSNGHAYGGGPFAIDIDVDLRGVDLQVAIDVLNRRQLAHLFFQNANVVVKIGCVRSLERHLVQTARRHAADAQAGRVLQKHAQARLVRKPGSQFFDDLIGTLALIQRFEADKNCAAVAA